MNKLILNPGNGTNFPKKGEYVRLNMVIYDGNKNVLFNSRNFENKFLEIRYNSPEGNFIHELEELIGEMSVFEKCSLEIDELSGEKIIESNEVLRELLKYYKKIIFEIEIVDISKTSFN